MQRMERFAVTILVFSALVAGSAAAGEVAIHGTVSQGYLSSSDYNYLTPDTKAGTFSFNEAIVNFSTMVNDKTRIGAQILGRDFGREGNGNVVLDWAFGDYRLRDQIGFRAGKVKTPLGFYNKTRDVDAVRTAVLMPQSVYNEGFRSVATAFQGVSVYGDLSLAESTSLEYEVFYGTVEMDGSQFLADTIAPPGAPSLGYSVETKYWTGGQLIWNTPLSGLRFGGTFGTLHTTATGSYQAGAPIPLQVDMDMKMNSIYVISGEYVWNDLTLASEYTRMDVDFSVSNNLDPMGNMSFKDERGGYYFQGSYRFSELFEFGTYYSLYYPNWNDRSGENATPEFMAWQKDWAVTARFDVTDFWLLKAEYHFMNGVGHVEPGWNTDSDYSAESWGMFAAKSTFYF